MEDVLLSSKLTFLNDTPQASICQQFFSNRTVKITEKLSPPLLNTPDLLKDSGRKCRKQLPRCRHYVKIKNNEFLQFGRIKE